MLSRFCLNELDGYSMQDFSSSHTSITNLQREEVTAQQLLIETEGTLHVTKYNSVDSSYRFHNNIENCNFRWP